MTHMYTHTAHTHSTHTHTCTQSRRLQLILYIVHKLLKHATNYTIIILLTNRYCNYLTFKSAQTLNCEIYPMI